MDLSDALGGATGQLRSVWGTAPDDMWISVDLDEGDDIALRHDGTSSEVMFTVPIEWKYEYDEPHIGQGCSVSRDDVWVQAATGNGALYLFHWSDGAWDEVDGGGGAFSCAPTALWRYGNGENSGPFAYRYDGDEWTEVVSFDEWQVRFDGLWAGENGDGWIVGSELDDEFEEWTQIWRISGDEVTPTLQAGSFLGEGGAIWQTDSGRVLAFGFAGLVLEYTGPE